MKKLLCLLLMSSTGVVLFAQQGNVPENANPNAQRWKMDGNNANQNDFIGTVNEAL